MYGRQTSSTPGAARRGGWGGGSRQGASAATRALTESESIAKKPVVAAPTAWDGGLDEEIAFWERYISKRGHKWPDDFRDRLNPNLPLQSELIPYVAHIPANEEVRILDCGAGPLTFLGKQLAARSVVIVPVDALADAYDRLLARHGIAPPVRTLRCEAERLDEVFAPNEFDLVHMRNALDHCRDAPLALRQMLRVVKPGSVVFLDHKTNVGHNNDYMGLHQWNICVEDGELVIWSPGVRVVAAEIPNVEMITISYHDERWITAVMRKQSAARR
jgi:SAM-dependent methyltransferase